MLFFKHNIIFSFFLDSLYTIHIIYIYPSVQKTEVCHFLMYQGSNFVIFPQKNYLTLSASWSSADSTFYLWTYERKAFSEEVSMHQHENIKRSCETELKSQGFRLCFSLFRHWGSISHNLIFWTLARLQN